MDDHDLNRLFLRGIWAGVIRGDDDPSWVDRVAARPATDQPLGDFGPIIGRMLEAGISATDIARFAKIIGYETAFGFCYHLTDPNASYEGFDDDAEDIAWCLFEIDVDSEEPVRPIIGLHEEILGLDPSGNEMRPARTT